MTTFFRLLDKEDKEAELLQAIQIGGESVFEVSPSEFNQIPGQTFAYWVSPRIRGAFSRLLNFESGERTARVGLQTSDDFRFVRLLWEIDQSGAKWFPFAKGGSYSPYYADVYLAVSWANDGEELREFSGSVIRNPDYYFRLGLTWPHRTQSGFGIRVLPKECIFGHKGPSVFVADDNHESILALQGILFSAAFKLFVSLLITFGSYDVGAIQKTPIPSISDELKRLLANRVRLAWSLMRSLDSVNEVSHAFILPRYLRSRLADLDVSVMATEFSEAQKMIDEIAFDLYGFNDQDRKAALELSKDPVFKDVDSESSLDSLFSWAVGVAFGRFDWRLATGERAAPPEPNPFDALLAKSPGMLPDGDAPFHTHGGILVDDAGHQHDLPRLVEEVLLRVDVDAPSNVRSWLKRDFFKYHQQEYSQSRRKAPIYWPLATNSGSYTLWVYYPELTSQTLFHAVNDFVEPKLKHVGQELSVLRAKGSARSSDEEKRLEQLDSLELELTELRDQLLKIAPSFKPSHDDGVEITASPLWALFQDRSWQKVLKSTWDKLEKGNYDWAHLAMNYWPERVREKCKKDKSLAIAHGLEDLFDGD